MYWPSVLHGQTKRCVCNVCTVPHGQTKRCVCNVCTGPVCYTVKQRGVYVMFVLAQCVTRSCNVCTVPKCYTVKQLLASVGRFCIGPRLYTLDQQNALVRFV